MCFNELLYSTFLHFRRSPEYREYKATYKRTYNLVRVDDFEYMAALGQGGFGRVVHARKKTTGQHLAMKIQRKTALLRHFRSDIAALESEKLGKPISLFYFYFIFLTPILLGPFSNTQLFLLFLSFSF